MGLHSSDYLHQHADEKKTVTVKTTRGGSSVSDEIEYASKLSARKARNTFGSLALEGENTTWVIPAALLDNVSDIRAGDVLTHGTTDWFVSQVTRDAVESQWICLCTKGR